MKLKLNISLTRTLVISFSFLVVIFSIFNLLSSFYLGLTAIDHFAERTLNQSKQHASSEYKYFIKSVQKAFELSASELGSGVLDVNNIEQLNKHFKAQMLNVKQVTSINIAAPSGQAYLLLKTHNSYKNRILTPSLLQQKKVLWHNLDSDLVLNKSYEEESSYDSRARPWYNIPQRFDLNSWTQPYTFQSTKDAGITVSRRIKLPDNSEIVLAFDVMLKDLSSLTFRIAPTPNTKAIIFLKTGHVIALPGYEKFKLEPLHNDYILRHYSMLGIPELTEILSTWDNQQATNVTRGEIKTSSGKYWYEFIKLSDLGEFNAWMAIYIPLQDLVSNLNSQLFKLIIISLLSIVFAILFALFLSQYFTKPMKEFLMLGTALTSLDSSVTKTTSAYISELSELSHLSKELRLIFNAFSRYMPKEVAQQLIQNKEIAKISASKENVALLSSDINNYSDFAKNTTSSNLLAQLEEYFNTLLSNIMKTQGVIDKFMTDSVVSFWGPPYTLPNPSLSAVKTLWDTHLAMSALNEKWQIQGKTPLFTRFSVVYGDALVGNFGASFRMHYSATGEIVSYSNKICQANKIYGTTMLVSQKVKRATESEFEYRLIDKIGIRQSASTTKIYELLGPIGHVPGPILQLSHQYEIALKRFFKGEYSNCSEILNGIQSSFPHDQPLKRLNNLAKNYAKNPPEEGSELTLL